VFHPAVTRFILGVSDQDQIHRLSDSRWWRPALDQQPGATTKLTVDLLFTSAETMKSSASAIITTTAATLDTASATPRHRSDMNRAACPETDPIMLSCVDSRVSTIHHLGTTVTGHRAWPALLSRESAVTSAQSRVSASAT
jgi:hypothetical protein